MPPTSHPLADDARSEVIRTRLTPAEKRHVAALADAEGRTVAEYLRLRLLAAVEAPSQVVTTFGNGGTA